MTSPVSIRGRNLALLAALLGWMFDGMEMGLFPLVGRDALTELVGVQEQVSAATATQGEAAAAELRKELDTTVGRWYGIVLAFFLVGAATGGVLFGWLGDKIGRVRAMTASILLYSVCSGLSAASQTPLQLAILRFLGALGMGGEWALGVALVMELWPGASRAFMAGLIGAFGNFGYLICGGILLGINHMQPGQLHGWITSTGIPETWASALTANRYWRMLMLVGAIPALMTMFIRLFVPESEKWTKEKEAGRASYWANQDLIGVLIGAIAACGVILLWTDMAAHLDLSVRAVGSIVGLLVVILGYLYPARRYLARSGLPQAVRTVTLRRMLLAAGLSGVPLLGTWAGLMWMYMWVSKLPGGDVPDAKPLMQITSSIGAAIGCMAGALLAGFLGRRPIYAILCILSMVSMIAFYRLNTEYGVVFVLSAGLLGMISASFYGWLPLYLPELFPTAVRATGQGFGFNFGRILAAAGNLQMANLLASFNNDYAQACGLVAGVYVVGLVLIFIAPETRGKPLPD